MAATRPALTACLLAMLCCAADYEQRQGDAVLRLRADKVEDGQVENRLSSPMSLTLAIEGRAPLQVGASDDEAVEEQLRALKQPGAWLRCEALGKPKRTPLGDGRERWEVTIRLDPLPPKDGKLELRPALTYTEGPEGAERKPRQVTWEPVAVRITTTVATPDVAQLRELTGPQELPAPPSPWRWLSWLALAVALAGLAAGGWGLRRLLASSPPPPPSPHEWAARELERIESLRLPEAGQVERFHTLLSDLVRTYLEQRFQLPASHQTTAEFLQTMRRSPQLSAGQQEQLRGFLERCDLAKFARAAATAEECRALSALARSFIEQTTPP